jgi:hypothetical protein
MAHAEAPEAQPAVDATLGPTLSSFFSLLSADFIREQQDATNSGATAFHTHPGDLKNVDASRVKRSRIARHSGANTVPNATLNRQSLARPRVVDVDQPPPLGHTERDVLFQEFLQWKARQTP